MKPNMWNSAAVATKFVRRTRDGRTLRTAKDRFSAAAVHGGDGHAALPRDYPGKRIRNAMTAKSGQLCWFFLMSSAMIARDR
jgi:hypothetical protein